MFIRRYKFTLLATVGLIGLIWLVMFLFAQDEQACKARGGHLVVKSAGKAVIELCISSDGRIIE